MSAVCLRFRFLLTERVRWKRAQMPKIWMSREKVRRWVLRHWRA